VDEDGPGSAANVDGPGLPADEDGPGQSVAEVDGPDRPADDDGPNPGIDGPCLLVGIPGLASLWLQPDLASIRAMADTSRSNPEPR